MKLEDYVEDNRLQILVKPNALRTEVVGYDDYRKAVKIAIKAIAQNNKANEELLRFLKQEIGPCTLKNGAKSRLKTVMFIK